MKQWIKIIVAIVCLTVGIIKIVGYSKQKSTALEEKKKKLSNFFYCEYCDKEFLAEGGRSNAICPECNQETSIIRINKRCNNCKNVFVQYELDTKTNCPRYPGGAWNPGLQTNRPCPNCGSEDLISLPERK